MGSSCMQGEYLAIKLLRQAHQTAFKAHPLLHVGVLIFSDLQKVEEQTGLSQSKQLGNGGRHAFPKTNR